MSIHEAQLGKRVRLLHCSDEYTSLPAGSLGTVTLVDSMGTVHVRWDSGSRLGMIPGVDNWEVIDDEPKLSWTQPQCERCWIDANGEWDMANDASETWQRLVGVRMPTKATEPPIERCSFCGAPTIVGIYVRADPASVPYPAKEASSE